MKIKFESILIFSIGVLVLAIATLSYLNLTTKLKVKSTNLNQINLENVDVALDYFEFTFNTPIQSKSLIDSISILPETEFSYELDKDTLKIIPRNKLLPDSTYTLLVNTSLKDIYNRSLEESYTIDFITRSYNIVYLQKNFPNSNDKIFSYNLKDKTNTLLYENIQILDFIKNKEYLAIIHTDPTIPPQLSIYNLNTGEEILVEEGKEQFYSYHFDSNNNLYYSAIDFRNSFGSEPTFAKLFKYNLDSQNKTEIEVNTTAYEDIFFQSSEDSQDSNQNLQNLGSTYADFSLTDFHLSNNQLLVKNNVYSFYYLYNLRFNTLSQLGTYFNAFGLNYDVSKALFGIVNGNNIETLVYDIASSTDIPILENLFTVDSTFFNNSNSVAVSSNYLDELSRGIYEIVVLDYVQEDLNSDVQRSITSGEYEIVDIINKQDYSLELVQPSFDDNYLLMEAYKIEDLRTLEDTILSPLVRPQRPNTSNILIYDLNTKDLVDTGLKGIEVIWD